MSGEREPAEVGKGTASGPLSPVEERAWRAAWADQLAAASAACPGGEELVALALGELGPHERRALADHVTTCAECAAAFRQLLALHEAAGAELAERAVAAREETPKQREELPRPGLVPPRQGRRLRLGPPPARTSPSAPAHRWRLWVVAAAMLLLAGVVVRQRLATGGGSVERGGPTVSEVGVEPPPGARLGSPPARLVWPAAEAGAVYRVVVYDAEAVPLWESGPLARPELALPASLVQRLAAGGTYYWRVRVASQRGPRASTLRRFEVAR